MGKCSLFEIYKCNYYKQYMEWMEKRLHIVYQATIFKGMVILCKKIFTSFSDLRGATLKNIISPLIKKNGKEVS